MDVAAVDLFCPTCRSLTIAGRCTRMPRLQQLSL